MLRALYRENLALATDLYQLTMAYGYWKQGMTEHEAVFHAHFRQHPFGGGYTVACGTNYVMDYLRDYHFAADDLAYLETLCGNDGKPLFERAFLDYLAALRFTCDVDAVPEGTVVFPHLPLLRVRGPLLQAQLIETPLLNILNFQSLIATKAARVTQAARGEPVLEFGLRRAQGMDGGMAASWAAYVGGCAATSNLLAGKLHGIPVKGTHAHAWVMCFDTEPEAFAAYAAAMPNNCVFLVDTYDTLEGVRHAMAAGRKLREMGHEMVGIRLDSGDLEWLSKQARELLDAGGFPDAVIVASNDLDEYRINALQEAGAPIGVWGVGTRLVTAYDQPALGGVYKLAAIRAPGGDWQYRLKLSEQAVKVSTPGILQVRRYRDDSRFIADVAWDEGLGIPEPATVVDPADDTRRKTVPAGTASEDLLQPLFARGELAADPAGATAARTRLQAQLAMLDPSIRRLADPYTYPAGLELALHDLKHRMILTARYGPTGTATPGGA